MDQFWTKHLRGLCDSLIAQTDRARLGSRHTQIKGGSIEYVIRRTLQDYMPSNFKIGTGQIANNQDNINPQIDVLIYDARTFPRLAVNEDSSVVVCSESVFAAVECKSSWDLKKVSDHFKKFVKVESIRSRYFKDAGMSAGYFVLVVDKMKRPNLPALFQDQDRFIGFYSLKGEKSWSSQHKKKEFSEQRGNALDIFLHDIMYDCMRKNLSELGTLEQTHEAVSQYLGWNARSSGNSKT